jgi:hypothetical protein
MVACNFRNAGLISPTVRGYLRVSSPKLTDESLTRVQSSARHQTCAPRRPALLASSALSSGRRASCAGRVRGIISCSADLNAVEVSRRGQM